jgi:hypothetical protein
MVGLSSCCKKALERGPLERAGSHIQHPIEAKETMQRNMPSARSLGAFAQFCRRMDKSTSAGGPRPAGAVFALKKDGEQQFKNLRL